MPNRDHRILAIVEDDLAVVARAACAVEDLEALMLKFSRKPIVTLDDIDRMSDDLHDIRPGLDANKKHLVALREKE